jgi:hypothetical protein
VKIEEMAIDRWQHHIDYRKHFGRNRLVPVDPGRRYEGVDEYGMRMVNLGRRVPVKTRITFPAVGAAPVEHTETD